MMEEDEENYIPIYRSVIKKQTTSRLEELIKEKESEIKVIEEEIALRNKPLDFKPWGGESKK